MPVGGCNVKKTNTMRLIFDSLPENESFARVAIAAFMVQLNPTLEAVTDVKTAVSEAVTNAVVHAYRDSAVGSVTIDAKIDHDEQSISIEVSDEGVGIVNIDQAMEPFFTTLPELERSGMGFSVMQSFMDELAVTSTPGHGTTIRMKKNINKR
jgi:stage II sporulation protein AB (anti-sigma F factor)